MSLQLANNAYATITSTHLSGDASPLTVTVTAGQGARFGAGFGAADGKWFVAALVKEPPNKVELVMCNDSHTADTFVCKRAWGGTTAQGWAPGDRFVLVGDATTLSEMLEIGGANDLLAGSGTANAITASLVSARLVLPDGFRVRVNVASANTNATPTFNLTFDASTVGGSATVTGAKTIVRGPGGGPLVFNDMVTAVPAHLQYNLALGKWILLNPQAPRVQSRVKGLVGNAPQGGAGIAQFKAQSYLMRNAAGDTVALYDNTAFTINTGTAGPAAGGRDQAGVFSNGALIHCYAIWDGISGNPPQGVASLVAPTTYTGPVLPSGYTWWAYLSSHVLAAGGVSFQVFNQAGDTVFYKTPPALGTNLDATVDTQIATATVDLYVPNSALSFLVLCEASSGWSGTGWSTFLFGAFSGSYLGGVGYFGTSGAQGGSQSTAQIPYVAAGLWYKRATRSGTQTSPIGQLWCVGYRVPN